MQMVLQRELRANSRRSLTYWGRFVAAAVGAFVLWVSFRPANNGRELFFTTAVIGFAFCLLDAVRRAGASLADEAEDGTLGLLLLTPLSGAELFFGKFFSVILGALPMVLALVP